MIRFYFMHLIHKSKLARTPQFFTLCLFCFFLESFRGALMIGSILQSLCSFKTLLFIPTLALDSPFCSLETAANNNSSTPECLVYLLLFFCWWFTICGRLFRYVLKINFHYLQHSCYC